MQWQSQISDSRPPAGVSAHCKKVLTAEKCVYACFFYLQKAFDTISRVKMFYNLLVNYKIGGKYLAILQSIYTENRMHIRLDNGLSQPFVTTAGVFQGCNMSPLLFNLYHMGPEAIFFVTKKSKETALGNLFWVFY